MSDNQSSPGAPLGQTAPASSPQPGELLPDEGEEVAQFCSACGTPKATFDVFCGNCAKPLVRRFALMLPMELAFFLGAGILLSLAHTGVIPKLFRFAPLVFLAQFVVLYLVRASLRQRRFLVLIALYSALVLGAVVGVSVPALFVSFAPLYLAFGVVLLWSTRIRLSTRWEYSQTLWAGLLIVGLSFGIFASANGVLQAQVPYQQYLRVSGNVLSRYVPWFTLAGLCVTLAIQSGIRVAKLGVFVQKDYYPNARIALRRFAQGPGIPFPVLIASLIAHALKRAGCSFYNALVTALNVMTRSLVFVWRIIQAFVVALVRELVEGIKRLVGFALLCVARIVLPLCAIYLAANASVESVGLIERHVFEATWITAAYVLWLGVHMLAFTFASVICFATVSVSECAESYVRDAAIVLGYGIPIFLLCSLALWLTTLGTRRYLELDLGFRFGQLSTVCLAVLILGAAFLSRSRLLHMAARLRRIGASDSDKPDAVE